MKNLATAFLFLFLIPVLPVRTAGDTTPKEKFTEVLMQYVNASFYTADIMDCFKALHTDKRIKVKDEPQWFRYPASVTMPEKTLQLVTYIPANKYAVALFNKVYNEKDVLTGEIDFPITVSWVREALGASYTEVKKISEDKYGYDHGYYFFASGADTTDKKNCTVAVESDRYSLYKHGVSNSVLVYGQLKLK